MDRTPWITDVVIALRREAADLRAAAARQEALANKIANPPEGVHVEPGSDSNTVRFVGPEVVVKGPSVQTGETP